MPEYRKTSYSEVDTWLRCNRRHYYSYGLKLAGKYLNANLERGIVGHAALAEYYRNRQRGFNHRDSATAAYLELAAIGRGSEAYDSVKINAEVATLVSQYFAVHEEAKFKVLAVESEYSIGILDDYQLPVRIDLILELPSGEIVAYDHKIVKDFYDEDAVELMPQLKLYKGGLAAHGVHVDRIVYNLLRWRLTNSSKENPAERFMRIDVPDNPSSVRRTMEEHLMAANRIKAWRAMDIEEWGQKVLRNTNACYGCPFRNLCKADLRGDNTELMKQYEYRPKTAREDLNS